MRNYDAPNDSKKNRKCGSYRVRVGGPAASITSIAMADDEFEMAWLFDNESNYTDDNSSNQSESSGGHGHTGSSMGTLLFLFAAFAVGGKNSPSYYLT